MATQPFGSPDEIRTRNLQLEEAAARCRESSAVGDWRTQREVPDARRLANAALSVVATAVD
ncbi:MAG: hypothetical protein PUP90_13515 [Nostoc sp. S4]|nr:hypothetical protein [Nostoc sp. S4]